MIDVATEINGSGIVEVGAALASSSAPVDTGLGLRVLAGCAVLRRRTWIRRLRDWGIEMRGALRPRRCSSVWSSSLRISWLRGWDSAHSWQVFYSCNLTYNLCLRAA